LKNNDIGARLVEKGNSFINKIISEIPDIEKRSLLIIDLSNDKKLIDKFANNTEFFKSWKILSFSDTHRRNIDNLQSLKDYLKKSYIGHKLTNQSDEIEKLRELLVNY
jgi:hypothetical protein